jgi:1-phosphofructokinase
MIYTFTANPSLDRYIELEEIKLGQVNRGTAEKINPGGKGINISRFLKTLGIESVVISFLGGITGEAVKTELIKEKIEGYYFNAIGETRTNITLADKLNKQITKINETGPMIPEAEKKKLFEFINSEIKKDDILVLSGNLTPGLDKDLYYSLIIETKKRGCICILDASEKPLQLGIKALPQVLHINKEEVEYLINGKKGGSNRFGNLAKLLIEEGIILVSISMGEEGGIFADPEKMIFVEAPKINVQSTVGAGDAMLAGMIYGMNNNFNLERIARFAVAAGSAKVMEIGTDVFKIDNIYSILPDLTSKEMN